MVFSVTKKITLIYTNRNGVYIKIAFIVFSIFNRIKTETIKKCIKSIKIILNYRLTL